MILPDFILPTRANQTWSYSGIDSPDHCLDKKYFASYSYAVEYCYNSRGYRDQEWPTTLSELQNAIWCVGDSFTVGLGNPVSHTWPYILQQGTQCRTINVSMDGASNNWMARKIKTLVEVVTPKIIIVQWSYVHRREKTQDIHDANDELRILQTINCTVEDDIRHTLDCIKSLSQVKSTQIVHSFIPNFVPNTHRGVIESQIAGSVIPEIQQLDKARDGHHYDIVTSQAFVRQLAPYLS